ncbi:AIPR family protein [Edwardsiella piscicida]|nr:AIPR family protein [Edwardsiella piscicida]ELM3729558.1 AIPR family protein [Edwardsiella piscicida]ELV7536766.1 AIPR family protein [Edwardsiella piscicida]
MAFVSDLTPEDNSSPAGATASVTAERIGNTLRERFQDYIHKRECAPTQSDYNVKMASRAIAAFVVHNLGLTDDLVAGSSVCDSSSDGGIDAIYVNHIEKNVVVVQAKFNQSGSATWSNADFLSFKSACEHLQEKQFSRFDLILQSMDDDITRALDSIDYTFQFVMAHTGKRGAANLILEDMQNWQRELNNAAIVPDDLPPSQLPFQVHLVSAEDIINWMRAQSSTTIDLNDVEIQQYGKIESPYTAYYGIIGGDQIKEWWDTHANKLFAKNIRNILGNTDVNESIKQTAVSDKDMFWYYNNGITILARNIEPYRRNNTRDRDIGRFNFTEVSVINGAQTVSSIGSLTEHTLEQLSDIKVHARFILIPNENSDSISNSITRANNHQNRVLGRDFASQHSEQLRLRDELIIEGYTYKLLRTDDSINDDNERVIDIDEALNALACYSCNPTTISLLKSYRGKFFENLQSTQYKSVFNSSVSGIKLINLVRHHRVIEQKIKQKIRETNYQEEKKRYGILTHANRVFAGHILYSIPRINSQRNISEINENFITSELDRILQITEDLIETNYPNAYPARFFSNIEKVAMTLKSYR